LVRRWGRDSGEGEENEKGKEEERWVWKEEKRNKGGVLKSEGNRESAGRAM